MKLTEKFERIQKVKLPFDMRHEDPKKDYGIRGMRVWFILKGPKGAVQFMFGTNTYLPHVDLEHASRGLSSLHGDIGGFTGWDVGYHAYEPQFDGQSPMGECDILGCDCYYDGSGLRASDWAKEVFSVRGEAPDELIWKKLEDYYECRFGEKAEGAHHE